MMGELLQLRVSSSINRCSRITAHRVFTLLVLSAAVLVLNGCFRLLSSSPVFLRFLRHRNVRPPLASSQWSHD